MIAGRRISRGCAKLSLIVPTETSAATLTQILQLLKEDRAQSRETERRIEKRLCRLEDVIRGTGKEGERGLAERLGSLETAAGKIATPVVISVAGVLVALLALVAAL